MRKYGDLVCHRRAGAPAPYGAANLRPWYVRLVSLIDAERNASTVLHGRRRIVASRDFDPVRVGWSPEYSSRASDESSYFRLFLTLTAARDESESMMLTSSTIRPASRRSLESAAASS